MLAGYYQAERQSHLGLYQLHAVVLGRIVGGRDHDTNVLPVQLARSKGCNQTDTGQDGVEDITAEISGGSLVSASSWYQEFLRFRSELWKLGQLRSFN